MKAISKVAILTLTLGLLVTATGCGEEGLPDGKTPEDVVRGALLNQDEVTKSIFEVNLVADLKGEEAGEPQSLNGTMNFSGTTDLDDNKMNMLLSLNGSLNKDSVDASLELRANKDGVWVNIDKVKVSDEMTQEMIDTMGADYIGVGWVGLSFVKADDMLEGASMKWDFEENDELPFKNLEYKGTADVLGLKSYHFLGEVAGEDLVDLLSVPAAEAEEFIRAAKAEVDLYVAVEENFLVGMEGTMKLDDQEMNGTVKVSFKLNPTKSNDVATPAKVAKEVSEQDLAMLMFGAMPTEPSALDMEGDYEMTDAEIEALMADLDEVEGMDLTDTQVEEMPELVIE